MAGEKLSKEKLATAEAVMTLGAVVSRKLQDHGVVALFIDADNDIQIALPGELELDGVPEEEAISALLSKGYDDTQLVAYLKGRDARKAYKRKLEDGLNG